MSKLSFLLFFALIFNACSGSRPTFNTDAEVPEGFPNHTLEDIQSSLNMLTVPVDAYIAESSLSVKTPARSGSFSASISHRKNDSLLITISMLGIQGVKTLVTPDSFYVHDRINKELTIGGIESLQKVLPLPVTSETLYSSMLGLLQPESMKELELSADSRYYTLLLPDENKKFMIDPAFWRVVRYEERSEDGSLIEERTFSEFDDIEGVYLPRRLTFRRPGDDMSASIYYRDININPRKISFDFKVNPSVQRIIIP
ncbi:MAG: DUF4292 domain-containing protein [Rhodothermaceae bacterium]|nr:DUF4292 domain-containing protein [Rhodothermaceae bacterium]